jgi:two-component system, chemotaxis family, protein-glutamate methylesterase/glutaminase
MVACTRLLMYQVVAIAASAGGLTALATVLSGLPREFPLPIAVVQHLDPSHESLVPEILARRTRLVVKSAEPREPMVGGVVYVARPDHHLLIGGGRSVKLTRTKPIHFVRPSADRLFESAARICGAGVIAVVLTGAGCDGAAGVEAVKRRGGIVIAQDQASSAFFGMPHAAIATGIVDFVLPLEQIAYKLVELTRH